MKSEPCLASSSAFHDLMQKDCLKLLDFALQSLDMVLLPARVVLKLCRVKIPGVALLPKVEG